MVDSIADVNGVAPLYEYELVECSHPSAPRKEVTPALGYLREKEIRALEYFGQKLEIDQFGYGNCSKIY